MYITNENITKFDGIVINNMKYLEIASLKNEKIKQTFKLRERKYRDKLNLTLLEGYRELSRASEYGLELKECFFCPDMFLGKNEYTLLENLESKGVKLYEVNTAILRKLAYRERPEGLIATATIMDHSLDNLPVKENGFYLVAEAIEKPGNLGSILRSADAAGVDGLILCDKTTDIYNPNVIRASTGALFSVPLAVCTSKEALAWLKEHNIKTLAATPHTKCIYTDVDLTQSVAIAVGTEQHGLSPLWMETADLRVAIPMLGKIDSLNVATATTILLYETARQRNWGKN